MSQAQGAAKKFDGMGVGEKLVFFGKVCVFFASFGFAFPTVLSG